VELDWMAFRRADFVARGPLDEKFAFHRHLGTWWSLELRAGADETTPPRGARRVELPLVRHEHRGWTSLRESERERLSRRNVYRILDRFRDRADLLSGPQERTATAPGDRRPA
jgi:hypothetical protein